MKKMLLSATVLLAISSSVQAQSQRLALYEEFTGENCGPCASTNPGLNQRVNAAPEKVMLIRYQVPIPSAGPIYNQNKTFADARRSYYGVNSAPNGRADGTVKFTGIGRPSGVGHPGYFLADSIEAAAAVPSTFTLSAAHSFNTAKDSVYITVVAKATQAFAPANALLKLRLALVETLTFTSAPGTNGEKNFENVVRNMYPSANGTALASSWTANQTQTFQISGPIQSFVNVNNDVFVAAWIQNDIGKEIAQSAKSILIPSSVANLPAFASSVALSPNPTNGTANLTLSLEKGTKLSVQVMDMTGRMVNTFAEQNLSAGTHLFPIVTNNLAAGVYNVRIATAEGVVTQRLSVVK